MKGIWSVIIDIVIKLVRGLLPLMSVELTELIQNWIMDFRERSRKTSNPWDDLIADFLYELFVEK